MENFIFCAVCVTIHKISFYHLIFYFSSMKLLDMGLEWEAANRLAEDRLAWDIFMNMVCPMGFLHANLTRTIN